VVDVTQAINQEEETIVAEGIKIIVVRGNSFVEGKMLVDSSLQAKVSFQLQCQRANP
jgi:hypothetical protein